MTRVAVYCASSRAADPAYYAAAGELGRSLAEAGVAIVYGGGGTGSMGAVADAALAAGGAVTGVIPRFMRDLEWGHRGLTECVEVADMHERKRVMLERADGVIALPGGCGTLEELFEAITWKRLGLYAGPVVMVNTRGFFDDCVRLLERSVAERFMDPRHLAMWSVVDQPAEALPALRRAPPWDAAARTFAVR